MTQEDPTCPTGRYCPNAHLCGERRLCMLMRCAPIDELYHGPSMTHFVGFRGEEYRSAVRAFGLPDFYHRTWDNRALQDIAPHDVVVFAKEYGSPSPYSFDDSNQPDDPAFKERLEK